MEWQNSSSKWILLIDYRMFVIFLHYLRHNISLQKFPLKWRHLCTNSSGTSNKTRCCYFSFCNNSDELSPGEPHPRTKEEVFNTLNMVVGYLPCLQKGGQNILIWSKTQYVHIISGIRHFSCIISFTHLNTLVVKIIVRQYTY